MGLWDTTWAVTSLVPRLSPLESLGTRLGCHYNLVVSILPIRSDKETLRTRPVMRFLSFVSKCTPLATFSFQESSFFILILWSLLVSIRESMCGSWLAPHQRSHWNWCRPTLMMSLILQHYSSTAQSKLHASVRKLNWMPVSVYPSDNLWSNYLLYRDNAVLLFCGVGFQYYCLQCITS